MDYQNLTEQELFDVVITHLINQKEKSIDSEGNCAYRGVNGLKCAAGILISDDIYKPFIEGLNWLTVVSKLNLPSKHQDLIQDLQNLHDDCMEDYENNIKSIAKKYKLEYKHLFNVSTLSDSINS